MAICNTGATLRKALWDASAQITAPDYPLSPAQQVLIEESMESDEYQKALGKLRTHQRHCRICSKIEGKVFNDEWHEK